MSRAILSLHNSPLHGYCWLFPCSGVDTWQYGLTWQNGCRGSISKGLCKAKEVFNSLRMTTNICHLAILKMNSLYYFYLIKYLIIIIRTQRHMSTTKFSVEVPLANECQRCFGEQTYVSFLLSGFAALLHTWSSPTPAMSHTVHQDWVQLEWLLDLLLFRLWIGMFHW